MRLVEDNDAGEGMAVVLVQRPREPGDDLVEARRLPLAGRRAQRRIGRKQDALGERDLGPLAEVAERVECAEVTTPSSARPLS